VLAFLLTAKDSLVVVSTAGTVLGNTRVEADEFVPTAPVFTDCRPLLLYCAMYDARAHMYSCLALAGHVASSTGSTAVKSCVTLDVAVSSVLVYVGGIASAGV
jgi:hypothetical protein